jgi:SPP1 gp7 family putative phage head morphogenesis protein
MSYTTLKNSRGNRVISPSSNSDQSSNQPAAPSSRFQDIRHGDGGMQIEKITLLRTNPDIGGFRTAQRMAEDPYRPDRTLLYTTYEECTPDSHLRSIMQRVYFRCTNSPIQYVLGGKQDDKHPVNQIIQTPYFIDLIEAIIDSKFWGHSLIQLNFLEKGFDIRQRQGIEVVHRANVRPAFGDFITRPGDWTNGINYRQPPYSNFLLEVGKPNDLGLLMSAVPNVIYKKFGVKDWAEFLEVYGMPISEIQFDPNVPGSREAAKKEAQERGSNSTVIIPIGSKFQIHDTAKAGNSQAFEIAANYHNKEMSKLILLQTMTTEDGASLSQSQVHQKAEDEAIAAYRMLVEFTLNYYLRPILELHGYSLGEGKLKYDNTEKYTKAQLADIFIKLSPMLDIPQSYLREVFGIPEPKGDDDVKTPSPTNSTPNDPAQPLPAKPLKEEKKKEEKAKKKLSLRALPKLQLPDTAMLHQCGDDYIAQLAFSETEIAGGEEDLLRRIYEKQIATGEIDLAYVQALSKQLIDAVQTGWQNPADIDYNAPDHLRKTMLEANVTRFSAAKSIALVQQLNAFKTDATDFNDFHSKAKAVLTDYNSQWLRTEYETAHAVARNASAYLHNEANADTYPYLEYQTIGDDRVRAAHAALDGMIFKIGDEALSRIHPPNGFNCRCEMIPQQSAGDSKTANTLEDAIGALGKDWQTMIDKGFDKNRGELGYVFDQAEEYINTFKPSKLNYEAYQLPTFAQVPNKQKLSIEPFGKSKADIWFKEQIGKNDLTDPRTIRLTDYRDRPIEFAKKLLTQLLYEKNGFLLPHLADTLNAPHEVWLNQTEGTYQRVHLLFFEQKSIAVTVAFGLQQRETIQSISLLDQQTADGIIDSIRKGLFINPLNNNKK